MIRYAIPLDGGHLLSHIPFSQLNNLAVHFWPPFFWHSPGLLLPAFFSQKEGCPQGWNLGAMRDAACESTAFAEA